MAANPLNACEKMSALKGNIVRDMIPNLCLLTLVFRWLLECINLLAAALLQLQECCLACIAGCAWHLSALVWWVGGGGWGGALSSVVKP